MYTITNDSMSIRNKGRSKTEGFALGSAVKIMASNTRIAAITIDVPGGLVYKLCDVLNIRKANRITAEIPHHLDDSKIIRTGFVRNNPFLLVLVSHKRIMLKRA